MRRFFTLLIAMLPMAAAMAQETEVTAAQAKNYFKAYSKKRVSVHDPSVIWDSSSKRYYIFGSHRGVAYTTDMQNWEGVSQTWKTSTSNNAPNDQAFVTPQVKKVTKGGVEVDMPAFNAMDWSARSDSKYNINGNMWAPDVIWNPVMNKWCMYLSINGDNWHSSIILLTSNSILGPYQYEGPVVICGFKDSAHSYKETDLELAIGTQSSLPSRYNVGNNWGRRWPHTIDPAVFYDEEGKLWMVYGSWSGGIWMLELDETTGLRDYNVSYPSTNGESDGVTSDPYYGTKIAGGYYVSGEGPYIEHIGDYYYLFISYGGFAPDGGYEMRIFRSNNPTGPYKDASNRSAIYTGYIKNYANGQDLRGEKIMGAYNNWGYMTIGECAQGHNSIIAAEDGRTYLIYHTKFNDGTIGHQVRVHQVFLNKNGWLVAAPFEYNGEEITDKDVAEKQLVSNEDIVGTYQLLEHKYKMDCTKMEEVTPVEISLSADGKVTGAHTGTWSIEPNTSYVTIKMGGVPYNGVIIEQQTDQKKAKTVAFTAMANNGVNVWGYKLRGDYAIAMQLNSQKVPVANGSLVKSNIDLYGMDLGINNVTMKWTSSEPTVISNYGKYNSSGLEEDRAVTLTARLESGKYFWQQEYNVVALSEEKAKASADWTTGMVAYYSFDNAEMLVNSMNQEQTAQLMHNSTTKVPAIEQGDSLRNGNVVHLNFGANGKESYVSMPNPLKGLELTNGATISFFVKMTSDNLWDALFGCSNGTARLFVTGNMYVGYNDGKTASTTENNNWLDINQSEAVQTKALKAGKWHHVVITFDRLATNGITIYVDGNKRTDKYNGSINGKTITIKQGFDYNYVIDHLAACSELYLGKGSFWGSPDARIDDVIIYDRTLSSLEVIALNQMINRANANTTSGIDDIACDTNQNVHNGVYDLTGRKVNTAKHGFYIMNGKKYIIK